MVNNFDREDAFEVMEGVANVLMDGIEEALLKNNGGVCNRVEAKSVAQGMLLGVFLYFDTRKSMARNAVNHDPEDPDGIDGLYLDHNDILNFDAMRQALAEQDADVATNMATDDGEARRLIIDLCLNGPANIYSEMSDRDILGMYGNLIAEGSLNADDFPRLNQDPPAEEG